MRFYAEPIVTLIASTEIDNTGIYNFLKSHDLGWPVTSSDSAEMISEFGGRSCYMSFNSGRKTNAEYLSHIIEAQHGSVLEHSVWNFAIWGISRALSHELVRHRAGTAFSQLSQRYVDESVAEYVVPPLFQRSPELTEEYQKDLLHIHDLYLKWVGKAQKLVERDLPHLEGTERRKNARQAARYLLPNATETKMLFSCNTRALRHIIGMRASQHADTEIRSLAVKLFKLAQAKSPALFSDCSLITLDDGALAVKVEHEKV